MHKEVYYIKKRFSNGVEVFMTNTHSELLELENKEQAQFITDTLNANTDSGCSYRVIESSKNN